METQRVVYDACRHYLTDRQRTLPQTLYDSLIGAIRSRNLTMLAGCTSLLDIDVADPETVRTLYQVEAFFKKNAVFTQSLPARLQALINFEDAEERCRVTNDILDDVDALEVSNPRMHRLLSRMRVDIEEVLGPFRTFLDELPKLVRVTSGATATRSRKRSLPPYKISRRMVTTPGAYRYVDALSRYFGYGEHRGRFVSRNRVEFVPKSWKTERTIACEPDGNIPLQLAFDSYVKRRLRRVGINLRDQTRNQEMAREGSLTGALATVDLSQASDTLSYNVVAALFPYEWFDYLRSIRSQYYEVYRGNRQAYHKFSSMGNGATFTIETLVFAAACRAVGSRTYAVYGDDIVIETELVSELTDLLALLGFIPNTEKTFCTGFFRESCGKYWCRGVDVTPKFVREWSRRKPVLSHNINVMSSVAEPFGKLATFLVELIVQQRLQLVPRNEDSLSGVWIDVHEAYEKKLIRDGRKLKPPHAHSPHVLFFKGYSPLSKKPVKVSDTRSLFLWHLNAFGSRKAHSRTTWCPLYYPMQWDLRSSTDETLSTALEHSSNSVLHELKRLDSQPSSWYTALSSRYTRKWIHWYPVASGATENELLFSELLCRELEKLSSP